MAKNYTLKSVSYDGRYLQVDCTQTTDIATNTSTINWKLSAIGGSVNLYSTGATTLTINGTQVYYKARTSYSSGEFPAAKGSVSGSLKVAHNNNGDKEINITLSTAIYTQTIYTATGKWTLDSIPRKATITTAPNITDEIESFDIKYSNLSSGNISLCISSDKNKIDLAPYRPLTKSGNSYSFVLTEEERQNLQNYSLSIGKAEFTIYFVLQTVIGSYKDYHTVSKTCTIADCKPVLTPVVENTDDITRALTGNPKTIIAGYGETAVAANAVAQKGATIVSYSITCGSDTIKAASGKFTGATDNTFKFSATDNRGQTTTATIDDVTVIPYTGNTCTLVAGMPTTDGELTFNIEGLAWFGNFGATDNILTVSYRIKENNEEFSEWQSLSYNTSRENGYKITHTLTGLNYRSSYTIEAKAVDKLHTSYSEAVVVQTIPVFDWSKYDFRFNVPVYIDGSPITDFIVGSGETNGWHYRLYNSGYAECWRRVQITTNVSNAWGSLYTSGALSATNLAYPFSFTEIPILTVSLAPFGSGGLVMATGNAYGSATNTGAFEIARGTSGTNLQFLLNYHAKGKWK